MENSHTIPKKAQSAMEYLMTYGWAILVIAIILGVLFALGVFNGGAGSINACQASPGYLCNTAIYSHTDANIIVSLGQNTGISWATANFVFVPQGTSLSNGVPAISFVSSPANTLYYSNGGLQSGGVVTVYLPVNSITFVPSNVAIGTPISGAIWVQYTYTYVSGGVQQTQSGYADMAQANLRAS